MLTPPGGDETGRLPLARAGRHERSCSGHGSRHGPPAAPSSAVAGGPRVRIHLPPPASPLPPVCCGGTAMRSTKYGCSAPRQRESFGQQWRLAEIRIIAVAGNDVGWMQTTPANDAIFLGQRHLEGRFQRQGIGSRVMRAVIGEATHERKAVTLGVVKINPARAGSINGWDLASPTRISIRSTCGVSRIGCPHDRPSGPLPHVRYRTACTMPAEKFEYGCLSHAPRYIASDHMCRSAAAL